MGFVRTLITFLPIVIGIALYKDRFLPEEQLEIHEDPVWGNADSKDKSVKQISVVYDANLEAELQARLKNWKKFNFLSGDRNDGITPNYLNGLISHWQTKFNWKEQVAKINQFKHFKTIIHGLDVHYIHAKPTGDNVQQVFPLLLLHGWPGSVAEFFKIIPMLTKSVNGLAFEVIAPSIPGYGWSDAADRPGFDQVAAAQVFVELMERLKFEEYYVQGGDWGAVVGEFVSKIAPENVIGFHTNMFGTRPVKARHILHNIAAYLLPSLIVGEEDAWMMNFTRNIKEVLIKESGYFHEQATKPDTLGVALSDSPAGLAAWIGEKFQIWESDDIPFEDILVNIMIYWTTNTITSSVRFYREFVMSPYAQPLLASTLTTPLGVACFRNELVCTPRAMVNYRATNLVHYSSFERGGHFAAMALPEVLAADLRKFVAGNSKLYGFSDV